MERFLLERSNSKASTKWIVEENSSRSREVFCLCPFLQSFLCINFTSIKIKCSRRSTVPWHRIYTQVRDASAAGTGRWGLERRGGSTGRGKPSAWHYHTKQTQQDKSLKPEHKWHPYTNASWGSYEMPQSHQRLGLETLSTHNPTQDQWKATRTWPLSTFVWSLFNMSCEGLPRQH